MNHQSICKWYDLQKRACNIAAQKNVSWKEFLKIYASLISVQLKIIQLEYSLRHSKMLEKFIKNNPL